MTGLEIIKAPGTSAGEIADIVSNPCPPVSPEVCDKFSCRECWLAWLTTGEPPKEKGASDKQTPPDEEAMCLATRSTWPGWNKSKRVNERRPRNGSSKGGRLEALHPYPVGDR